MQNRLGKSDQYFFAEQPALAPHLAHPVAGCADLRIVSVTVPRVSRSCEHFPSGKELLTRWRWRVAVGEVHDHHPHLLAHGRLRLLVRSPPCTRLLFSGDTDLCVKSLRSSYTTLYPQSEFTHRFVSPETRRRAQGGGCTRRRSRPCARR